MHPADLEGLADAELRRLPAPRAPRTLLPRVLAAVATWSMTPWYARAWFTWPVAGQIAATLALAAGSALVLIRMQPVFSRTARLFGAPSSALADVISRDVFGHIEAMTIAGEVIYRALLVPIMPIASILVILMSLTCAAFGMALKHVVSERS